MLILIATVLACWLTIARAPDTATGRMLHDLLVRRPAGRLSRITQGDVASAIVLAVAVAMIAFVGETEKARTLMFAMPDIAIWITTFEMSSVADVLIAVAVAVSTLRTRVMGTRIRSIVRRPRARVRRPRPSAPANDDEPHGMIAIAA